MSSIAKSALSLTDSQTVVKGIFEPGAVGRIVKITAMNGAKQVESGLYLCTGYRATRGCNGNSWITLEDSDFGTVELDWRSGVVSEIEAGMIVSNRAEMAKFFAAA
jgi:hypothetical protein